MRLGTMLLPAILESLEASKSNSSSLRAEVSLLSNVIQQITKTSKAGNLAAADIRAKIDASKLTMDLAPGAFPPDVLLRLDLGNPNRRLLHEGLVFIETTKRSPEEAWLLLLDTHCMWRGGPDQD